MPNPHMPNLGLQWSDKIFHGIAFMALSASLCLWFRPEAWLEKPIRTGLYVVVLTVFAGILDELHQLFVPNRVASISDVIADGIGAILGMLVGSYFIRLYIRFNGKKTKDSNINF